MFLPQYPDPLPQRASLSGSDVSGQMSGSDVGIGLLLEPFATEVWVMVVLAFVTVSLALFLIGRYSPYEASSSSRCGGKEARGGGKEREARQAKSSFSLKNCFLFTASTMAFQGGWSHESCSVTIVLHCSLCCNTLFLCLVLLCCIV